MAFIYAILNISYFTREFEKFQARSRLGGTLSIDISSPLPSPNTSSYPSPATYSFHRQSSYQPSPSPCPTCSFEQPSPVPYTSPVQSSCRKSSGTTPTAEQEYHVSFESSTMRDAVGPILSNIEYVDEETSETGFIKENSSMPLHSEPFLNK